MYFLNLRMMKGLKRCPYLVASCGIPKRMWGCLTFYGAVLPDSVRHTQQDSKDTPICKVHEKLLSSKWVPLPRPSDHMRKLMRHEMRAEIRTQCAWGFSM